MLQENSIIRARGILLFSWLWSKSCLLHLAELPYICCDPFCPSSLPSFPFNGVSLAQAGLRVTVQLWMNLDSPFSCLRFLTARPLQVCSTTPVFYSSGGTRLHMCRASTSAAELARIEAILSRQGCYRLSKGDCTPRPCAWDSFYHPCKGRSTFFISQMTDRSGVAPEI